VIDEATSIDDMSVKKLPSTDYVVSIARYQQLRRTTFCCVANKMDGIFDFYLHIQTENHVAPATKHQNRNKTNWCPNSHCDRGESETPTVAFFVERFFFKVQFQFH
jgi:hypothetical protein